MSLTGPSIVIEFGILNHDIAATTEQTVLRAVACNAAEREAKIRLIANARTVCTQRIRQDRAANVEIVQSDPVRGEQYACLVLGELEPGAVEARSTRCSSDRDARRAYRDALAVNT